MLMTVMTMGGAGGAMTRDDGARRDIYVCGRVRVRVDELSVMMDMVGVSGIRCQCAMVRAGATGVRMTV